VGGGHACGLTVDKSILCWGNDSFGKATPPQGSFTSVSAGTKHTCGLKTGGAVICWGSDEIGQAAPPLGSYASISAGAFHTCGVKLDKSVVCWGDNDHGQATPSRGTFGSVSAGLIHTCGLLTGVGRWNGYARCWGAEDSQREYLDLRVGLPSINNGNFTAVSAGGLYTCGLRRGSAVCWGSFFYTPGPGSEAQPPAAKFSSISVGHVRTCGVTTQGALLCWHYHKYGEYAQLGGTGEFSSVSVGSFGAAAACAVRSNGSVTCWTSDELGALTPICMPRLGGNWTRDC
jgi:hypothetical protein